MSTAFFNNIIEPVIMYETINKKGVSEIKDQFFFINSLRLRVLDRGL